MATIFARSDIRPPMIVGLIALLNAPWAAMVAFGGSSTVPMISATCLVILLASVVGMAAFATNREPLLRITMAVMGAALVAISIEVAISVITQQQWAGLSGAFLTAAAGLSHMAMLKMSWFDA